MDPSTSPLIPLNSPHGTTLLAESYATNYPILQQNFEGQINGAFCGIASSVIVVNSLIHLHHESKKSSQKVNQETIFKISGVELIPHWNRGHVTLAYLEKLIRKSCEALKIRTKISIFHGDQFGNLEEFQKFLVRINEKEGVFSIANYRRKSMGLRDSAHISPIGAYHQG